MDFWIKSLYNLEIFDGLVYKSYWENLSNINEVDKNINVFSK